MRLSSKLKSVFAVKNKNQGSDVKFQKSLIPTLISEHKELRFLHYQVINAASDQNSELTRQLLGRYKTTLVNHLLKENNSLYTYLKHSIDDHTSTELIINIKNEMDDIGRTVTNFLQRALAESYEFNYTFITEFQNIGDILDKRMRREERFLYSYYQQQRQQND